VEKESCFSDLMGSEKCELNEAVDDSIVVFGTGISNVRFPSGFYPTKTLDKTKKLTVSHSNKAYNKHYWTGPI
jgi:hypothetical protein